MIPYIRSETFVFHKQSHTFHEVDESDIDFCNYGIELSDNPILVNVFVNFFYNN